MDRHSSPQSEADSAEMRRGSTTRGAFSLIEVTLAIGIIAFAFVALLGLLPNGMQVFRDAIDSSNETWIMQGLNSMVQTTNFSDLGSLGSGSAGTGSGDVYYYDEEGRQTDTELRPSSDPQVQARRLYAAKLLIERVYQPTASGESSAEIPGARRVIVVMVNLVNTTAKRQFDGVTSESDLRSLPKNTQVRAQAFMVAQMDRALEG